MHNCDSEKLLKMAHLRGWSHQDKWKESCPVCKAEEELALVANINSNN